MRWARSLAAVAAGCAAVAGILRLTAFAAPPPQGMNYFLASAVFTILGAVVGGYIAAWIAGSREIAHAAGVGLLMIFASFLSMRRKGAVHPGWYQTTVAGCGPISAMLGAALRLLTQPRHRI